MDQGQGYLAYLQQVLEGKSQAKQKTYKNLLTAFSQLKDYSVKIVESLKSAQAQGSDVVVEYRETGEHEFQVKLAGDLLIFVLHTNIVTLERGHPILEDTYVKGQELNGFFGQIMVYNFMSDSLAFNRGNDAGYLLARLMVNHENRFFVEGEGRFSLVQAKISDIPLQGEALHTLVALSMVTAIENDLVAPPYSEIKDITLFQKLEHTMALGAGRKIGFRMKYGE